MLRLLFCAVLASAKLLELEFAKVSVKGPSLRQRDLGLPLANDLLHQRYLVNLTIGTPPQQFALTVDTGSTDLFVPSPNSSGCLPFPCPPGTFDASDSSTAKLTGNVFNATYGLTPDLQVVGPYYNDTVHLGDAVIPNMTVGNVPKAIFDGGIFGLLGLGPRLAESIYRSPSSPYYQNASATFPTIYDQLELHGYTHRKLFSLWLNDQAASTGSILFGGVDSSKYRGKLRSLPVILSGPNQTFTDWAVNLTSISYLNCSSGGNQSVTPNDFTLTTILDSGSPNMYLPSALANSISSRLNSSMQQGFPYVSCALRHSRDGLEFGFGGNTKGLKIKVPVPEVIYPFGYPANIGNVTASDGTQLCYLGLIGVDSPISLLGATFIRSAYVVYDVDNLQVAMAPAVYGHGHK